MGLFRIAHKLRIDLFAAPFAGVSPAGAVAQSLRERSVLMGVLACRVGIPGARGLHSLFASRAHYPSGEAHHDFASWRTTFAFCR